MKNCGLVFTSLGFPHARVAMCCTSPLIQPPLFFTSCLHTNGKGNIPVGVWTAWALLTWELFFSDLGISLGFKHFCSFRFNIPCRPPGLCFHQLYLLDTQLSKGLLDIFSRMLVVKVKRGRRSSCYWIVLYSGMWQPMLECSPHNAW